jgi:hypothetical protein
MLKEAPSLNCIAVPRVSDPWEQPSNTNVSDNFKLNSKIFLNVNKGSMWDRFMEKTKRKKIRPSVPFRKIFLILENGVFIFWKFSLIFRCTVEENTFPLF